MTENDDRTRIDSEARHKLGYDQRRRGDRIRAVLLAGVIVWVAWLQWAQGAAVENESQLRKTLVPFAVQVQTECADPAIAKQAPDVCKRAEEIVEEEEEASGEKIVSVPGKNASPEQIAAAVEVYLAEHPIPLPEGVTQKQINAAVAAIIDDALVDYFAKHPIPIPRDGADGADGANGVNGVDGTDGVDGASGPACPGGAEPIRFTFKGTAAIKVPAGTYLWCRA